MKTLVFDYMVLCYTVCFANLVYIDEIMRGGKDHNAQISENLRSETQEAYQNR